MIIKVINGAGIQFLMDNGNVLSVMVSKMHHCSNGGSTPIVPTTYCRYGEEMTSPDVEVCIWNSKNEVITNQFIDCGESSLSAGYFKVGELPALITAVDKDDRTPMPLQVWRND